MQIKLDDTKLLPTGRPHISLPALLKHTNHPKQGQNPCVCSSLVAPKDVAHDALVNGLQKVFPFMYRSLEQAIQILLRYGMNFPGAIPLPTSFSFQFAHTGEILTCLYFEECEGALIPIYKWRLNTSNNQHQLGMDLIAFKFTQSPPEIYLIAVKTTTDGDDGKTPSAVYSAIRELRDYLAGDKLADDLEIIAANVEGNCKTAFLDWYDPYSQGVPANIPILIAAPAIVAEEKHWKDEYALPAIKCDFGVPAIARILSISELEDLVRKAYS